MGDSHTIPARGKERDSAECREIFKSKGRTDHEQREGGRALRAHLHTGAAAAAAAHHAGSRERGGAGERGGGACRGAATPATKRAKVSRSWWVRVRGERRSLRSPVLLVTEQRRGRARIHCGGPRTSRRRGAPGEGSRTDSLPRCSTGGSRADVTVHRGQDTRVSRGRGSGRGT